MFLYYTTFSQTLKEFTVRDGNPYRTIRRFNLAISASVKEAVWGMVNTQGMTIEEVAQIRGVDRKTIVDYLTRYDREKREEGVVKEEESSTFPILVIGDTHFPFEHPNYLQFCKDKYKEYGCKTVVHIGDLVDQHALSRHDSETDALGATCEYKKALESIKKWIEVFPNVNLCLGNHCAIHKRQAATLGIGEHFLKSFSEVWNLPSTWKVATEHIIENILFTHGTGCSGVNGALNLSIQERMSAVIGHLHSHLGVKYNANPRDIIFGLCVGCGIDVDAYAFRYGKFFKLKPTLGCGIIESPTEAYAVPMTSKYFRSNS